MRQLMEGISNGKKYVDEYRKNYIPQGSFGAFVQIMCSMSREKQTNDSKPVADIRGRITKQIDVKKDKIESPVLSSTKTSATMAQYDDSPHGNVPTGDIKISYIPKMWNFHEFEMDRINISNNNPIGVPAGSQEVLVITELLYCLMGVDGDLFQAAEIDDNSLVQFNISSKFSYF